MIEHTMSRRQWPQLKALVGQELAGVTESDLNACHGQRSKLIDKLQEIYGISSCEAEGAVVYYEQPLAIPYGRGLGRAGYTSGRGSLQYSASEFGHS